MIPVILLIAFGLVKQEFPYEISWAKWNISEPWIYP
jgi:hypothetical protein